MIYTDFVKDALLGFLQQLFSQEHLYGTCGDQLQNAYQWNYDHNLTKIMIMDQNTENLEAVEKRPALILTRGPIQWQKLSLDQFLNRDLSTGSRTYADLLSTSLRVNCFSREGLEAEFLASIVFQCVQYFVRDIRAIPNMHSIESVSVGEESIVASDSRIDLTVVPVILSMYVKNSWKTTEDGVLVNSFGLTINAGQKLPDGRSPIVHVTDP